jgi:myo-inositol-1(or 4)-monophosphatase
MTTSPTKHVPMVAPTSPVGQAVDARSGAAVADAGSSSRRTAAKGSTSVASKKPAAKAKPSTTRNKARSAKKPGVKKAKLASPKKPAKKKPPVKRAPAKKAAPAKAKAKSAGAKKAAPKPPKTKTNPPKTRQAKRAAPATSPAKKAPAPPKPVPNAGVVDTGATVREKAPSGRGVSRDFLMDLAASIREAVVPVMESGRGREIVGKSASGDVSFELDRVAEKALLGFLKKARVQVAYYSEESGYSTFSSGQPKVLLVVDPIDGSRSAKSGFESCVVSVATTRVIERPRMGDVEQGLVMELVGNRAFYAERGKGARIYTDGQARRPRPTRNANLESIAWSMTIPARPAELIFPTAARLIDLSSLKGGFFMCNSIAYSITRLLTGQLDACVDFANRYLRDIPTSVEDHFINAGRGAVLGLAPYDIAAAVLIAEEAGCLVSDAYGSRLEDVLLLDSSPANHRSIIAASNRELYAKMLSFFDTRINQFEQLLKRRMGQ